MIPVILPASANRREAFIVFFSKLIEGYFSDLSCLSIVVLHC